MKDSILNLMLGICLIAIIGALFYFLVYNNIEKKQIDSPNDDFSYDDRNANEFFVEEQIEVENTEVDNSKEEKPDNVLDIGTWGEHSYENETLGFRINVPKGWSVTKLSRSFMLSEFLTGNYVEFSIDKYSTSEREREYENSQGKPRGINYREREVLGTEELAGSTYLTLSFDVLHIDLDEDDNIISRDVNNVAYSEKYYYKDVVWDYNDWDRGDDVLEIRCHIKDKKSFDINKIISKY